jgi:hypothetical protein
VTVIEGVVPSVADVAVDVIDTLIVPEFAGT